MPSAGVILCLASAAAFGAMGIFGKLAYGEGATVGTLLAWRFVLAALLFWLVLLATGRPAACGRCPGATSASRSRSVPSATAPRRRALRRARAHRRLAARAPRLHVPGHRHGCGDRARPGAGSRDAPRCRSRSPRVGSSSSSRGRRRAAWTRSARCSPRRRVVYSTYILSSQGVASRLGPLPLSTLVCTGAATTLTIASLAAGDLHPATSAYGRRLARLPRRGVDGRRDRAVLRRVCGASDRRRRRSCRRSSRSSRSRSPSSCSASRSAAQLLGGALVLAAVVAVRAPARIAVALAPSWRRNRRDTGTARGRVALVAGATRGAGAASRSRSERPARPSTAPAARRASAAPSTTGRRRSRRRRARHRRRWRGIAVAVDHLDPTQVEALVRGSTRAGRLDVLVNDIWGGERLFEWNTPVWEHDLEKGLRILRLAVDTHLITSHFALPLLIRRPGGLVVEMTDGTREYNATRYRVSMFYDLAKTAVRSPSRRRELAPHGCTAVALTPGWLRSEMMLENYGVTEANWRDARPSSRTSRRSRRARCSSAVRSRPSPPTPSPPAERRLVLVRRLAREYGFTDLDGSQPDCWRYMVEVQDPVCPPTRPGIAPFPTSVESRMSFRRPLVRHHRGHERAHMSETTPAHAHDRRRWYALALLCVVQFMVVLDIAIVNVALPSIQADLKFSEENLQWVISAYSLVFGVSSCSAAGWPTSSADAASSWRGSSSSRSARSSVASRGATRRSSPPGRCRASARRRSRRRRSRS